MFERAITSVGLSTRPRVAPFPAATVIVASSLAGGSLVIASVVVLIDGLQLRHPGHQALAAGAVFLLGWLVLLGALRPRVVPRVPLFPWLLLSLAVATVLPTVRFVPWLFDQAYDLDLEGLFPPLWPFSVSIPLLVVALVERAIPTRPWVLFPGSALVTAMVAAVLLLFFGATLLGSLSYTPALLVLSERMLAALWTCIGLATLVVAGAVLAKKGLWRVGIVLLVLLGLSLEGASTLFYDGPPGWLSDVREPSPYYPLVPALGGTVPGALALVASWLIWRVHFLTDGEEPEAERGSTREDRRSLPQME